MITTDSLYTFPDTETLSIKQLQLPCILQRTIDLFPSEEQKLIMTNGIIAACSGLFTRVKGNYHNKEVFPNTFYLLSAPAASGKGVLNYIRPLLNSVHDKLRGSSTSASQSQQTPSLCTANIGKTYGAKVRTTRKILFVPGNITNSRFLQHLNDNQPDGPMIMLETELDTVSKSNKSEFGGFSDILRKAFHAETISLTRKTDDEFIEIQQPKFSLVFSGTPNQIQKMIPSAEDGLFSRFLFQTIHTTPQWEDVSSCGNRPDISKEIRTQASYYQAMWEFYKDRDVCFHFSQEQWDDLNARFTMHTQVAAHHIRTERVGLVKRHGLMLYKLCMTLTAMRMYCSKNTSTNIYCMEEDYITALFLTELSLNAAFEVLDDLPSADSSSRQKQEIEFLYKLPYRFSKLDAQKVGESLGVSGRSIRRYILNAQSGRKIRPIGKDLFEKVAQTA